MPATAGTSNLELCTMNESGETWMGRFTYCCFLFSSAFPFCPLWFPTAGEKRGKDGCCKIATARTLRCRHRSVNSGIMEVPLVVNSRVYNYQPYFVLRFHSPSVTVRFNWHPSRKDLLGSTCLLLIIVQL